MTREEFDALIGRLEKVSRKHPRLYNVRLAGLVALAYGYLLLILFGSLALCVLMIVMVFYMPVTVKFALIGLIAFGGIFVAVARGLWVKLQPPKGETVTRQQAPKLFALLDELRTALDCSPFHKVLVIGEMNAGVVQIPRLGIFGWHRNYLVIGLPLLQALAPEEFKAVLAHEFAHSSRGHGRFGNWLYRVRRTWAQIFEQMAKHRTHFGGVLVKFLNWFWPVFNGHVFVLARANEYEADACSVRLAGADAAASALIRVRMAGALMGEKFWPDIYNRIKTEDEPPVDVLLSLNQTFRNGPAADEAARWLRQSYLIETNNADTHPCLKDRLKAIDRLPPEIENGNFPDMPPSIPAQIAADYFLGDQAQTIARKMSEDWRKFIQPQWKARHAHVRKLAGELAGMDKPLDKPPTAVQVWEKAHKLVELHGDDAALATLEQVVALDPKHSGANFILGRHHLKMDDARGVAFIEMAMSLDPMLTPTGCNLLYGYFNRTGQREKMRPLENRVDEFQKLNVLAQQERARVTAADTFLAHQLNAEQVAALQKILSSEPEIVSAAVARKQVVHFPKFPLWVVSLQLNVPWWKVRSTNAGQELAKHLAKQISLPGNTIVFTNEKKLKGLGTKVCAVPGAVVYVRATVR